MIIAFFPLRYRRGIVHTLYYHLIYAPEQELPCYNFPGMSKQLNSTTGLTV